MMHKQDLLIEIGTEELPPQALSALSKHFFDSVGKSLDDIGLSYAEIKRYATPRRLALVITQLLDKQADQEVEKRGPALSAAYDKDGKPTKAALGFAKSCGVDLEQLDKLKTDKGEWLYFKTMQAGKAATDCISDIVRAALAALPIPKRMRWGSGDAQFVRPVHWIVLLYGSEIIDAEILGVQSDRNTYGHRFHHPAAISLATASDYPQVLADQAFVIADFAERKAKISQQVSDAAKELSGAVPLDDELLDEVTALVEWPVPVTCSFEQAFLEVPAEALVSTMKDNQKYFPVYDAEGNLTNNFIVISNLQSQQVEQVQLGNERVIRPRLADAQFFWDQDRKHPLSSFNDRLQQVVFHRKLGTVFEKVQRVAKLAEVIAKKIGANQANAVRAAELCKADLMTEMVFEFPKLQGIMGNYYAQHSGEDSSVAMAIEQHYWPRYAGDELPNTNVGQCVALADKFDTLVGIFAAGEKPSGVRDPFALRRSALGIIKIIIEKRLNLDLQELLEAAADFYRKELQADEVVVEVLDFIFGRLKSDYESTEQGFTPQQVAAVLACRPTRPFDFDQRIRAVAEFSQMDEAAVLAEANKRTANILKKVNDKLPNQVDKKFLQEPAELELHELMQTVIPEVGPLCAEGRYSEALKKLATLKTAVDNFFDKVFVMSDDQSVKNNRLALLKQLHAAFTMIADISLLPS